MLHQQFSATCILGTLLFFINTVTGQQRYSNHQRIDSLTTAVNKEQLNALSTGRFEKKTYAAAPVVLNYRFLRPAIGSGQQRYPLVITLHNSVRTGTDNESQLEPLARIWLRENISTHYPCFVLAPQFSKRSSTYEKNRKGIVTSQPSVEVYTLLKLADSLLIAYPAIDPSRVYLVGYSMGASTAFNLLNLQPQKFAAMVAIAPVPDLSGFDKLKDKNIWLIHGMKDIDNPYSGSLDYYKKAKGYKHLQLTSFTFLTHHNIMIPFLLSDEIPKWLFNKQL